MQRKIVVGVPEDAGYVTIAIVVGRGQDVGVGEVVVSRGLLADTRPVASAVLADQIRTALEDLDRSAPEGT